MIRKYTALVSLLTALACVLCGCTATYRNVITPDQQKRLDGLAGSEWE